MTSTPDKSPERAEVFIAHWQGQEGGQERANYSLFLIELCDLLGLPHPIQRARRANATIMSSSA